MNNPRALPLPLALVLTLALLLPALPTARAHFEETNLNAGRLEAGPFIVSFQTSPSTLFQGASVTLTTRVAPAQGGTPYQGPEIEARITVEGPAFEATTKTLDPDGRSYFLTTFRFPGTGVYDVRIDILERSSGQQGSATTTVEVFPDMPFRIRPIDTAIVVFANRTTTFDFEVVNATVLTRDDRVQDLTARIEHWADDHVRLISTQEIQGTRVSAGAWRFVATPTASGMHHFRFASLSGGFNYAESPPLHAYVDPDTADAPAEEPKGTPFVSVGLVGVAVLGVAMLFRRR